MKFAASVFAFAISLHISLHIWDSFLGCNFVPCRNIEKETELFLLLFLSGINCSANDVLHNIIYID